MEAYAINLDYLKVPDEGTPQAFLSNYAGNVSINRDLFQHSNLEVNYQGTLCIRSEDTQLHLRKGAKVIFLRTIKDDFRFINCGVIETVTSPLEIPDLKNAALKERKVEYLYPISFKIERRLEKNNELRDLQYSLPIVYNYNNPKRHFQLQYRNLLSRDYDTIVNGWVYLTRTVFGKIVNALPRQNKLEFMLQATDHFSTIDFRQVPLLDGLDFLNNYIAKRLLSRGKLLVATNNILNKQLRNIIAKPKEVGFVNPETHEVNYISQQAVIFEKVFEVEAKVNLSEKMRLVTQQNAIIEKRFKDIFDKETWPIDLKA